MQWLKRIVPPLLVLGAAGVVIATLFSSHADSRGSVPLPQGGEVYLPSGKTTIFAEPRTPEETDTNHVTSPFALRVVPATGGDPLPIDPISDDDSPNQLFHRSQEIGQRGAVATIDAPASGRYVVTGSFDDEQSGSVNFGLTSFGAVKDEWKLIGGLLLAAFLISIVPVPKRGPGWERDEGGSGPGDYKPPRFSPYEG